MTSWNNIPVVDIIVNSLRVFEQIHSSKFANKITQPRICKSNIDEL